MGEPRSAATEKPQNISVSVTRRSAFGAVRIIADGQMPSPGQVGSRTFWLFNPVVFHPCCGMLQEIGITMQRTL